MKALHRKIFTERVIMIWNNLPYEVKSSNSVNDFKINRESFKRANIHDVGSENVAYFWRVSSAVLSKIENKYYLENKEKLNEYLSANPFAAKKLFINMKGYTSLVNT